MKLRELHNNVANIGIFEKNFEGSKRMVINVEGTQYTLSEKLSADIRAGKVQLDELGDFEVREVEAQDGTKFFSLGYVGGELTTVVIGSWKGATKVEKKELSLADFKARFFKQTVALS